MSRRRRGGARREASLPFPLSLPGLRRPTVTPTVTPTPVTLSDTQWTKSGDFRDILERGGDTP